LSRLLAIPHFVVLLFLAIAFVLLTIVAFFAILVTGRYPRGIFDFNLGVLRWGWRVVFYSYGALGTDRYPPFTLAPVPDYPASVDIPYPEQLSRGLVLVKWWLLAIPHYLILGVILGRGGFAWKGGWDDDGRWGGPPGLDVLLVLIAAIALLFTTRYPRGDLRLRHGPEPVGAPRRRLRRPDDGRLSALPPRPGRGRAFTRRAGSTDTGGGVAASKSLDRIARIA
jgi:hypothetical protein